MSMSYWRSSRDRIEEQVKVESRFHIVRIDLTVTLLQVDFESSEPGESDQGYGAILPQMAVAGTITR